MTTRHCSGSLDFLKQLEVGAPGDRYVLHAAEYSDSLDSYKHRIQGGLTWGSRTTIEARVSQGKRDRVVLRPTSADVALRLAHPANRNIEFIGIAIDASFCSLGAIKVTYSDSTDPRASGAHGLRFTDCEIHNSQLSCVFSDSPAGRWDTRPVVELLRCDIHHAGLKPGATSHAVYAPGGGVLISRSWLHDCTSIGACFYSAAPEANGSPLPPASRIEYSQVYDCRHSGIVLAGQGDTAIGNTVVDCGVGIHVWPTARGWRESGNLVRHNRDHQVYIDPAAIDCYERTVA